MVLLALWVLSTKFGRRLIVALVLLTIVLNVSWSTADRELAAASIAHSICHQAHPPASCSPGVSVYGDAFRWFLETFHGF